MKDMIYYGWPYLGLVIAVGVAILLFRERPGDGRSRWRYPAWAFGWVGPVYLLHQFEEHGIDLLGRPYAFLGEICQTLGYIDDCALDPSFVLVVNVGWSGSARWSRGSSAAGGRCLASSCGAFRLSTRSPISALV